MLKKAATMVMIVALFCSELCADSFDASRNVIRETNETLKASQETINDADTEGEKMFSEYKAVMKEIDNYKVYNRQLADIVKSQETEMAVLQKDIDNIETTRQAVMPFMERMITGLERFIASDLPFLPEERAVRIRMLKENMKRADISIAAKYRQILDAYQIEIDYGKTVESYQGTIDGKKVNFLKVGRIGLYTITPDKKECAAWHPGEGKWQVLDDIDYHLAVTKAINIAKKQRAPDFFFAAVYTGGDK